MTTRNFILLTTFLASIFGASYSYQALADDSFKSTIETSKIEDDIKDLNIQPNDLTSSGVFYVAEDCYSGVYNQNYNLYLYYYNKDFINDVFPVNSNLNFVTIGNEIKTDGTFTSYFTFKVDIVDYNDNKSYCKLRLSNVDDKKSLFNSQDNTNYIRNYYISSIELKMSDNSIVRSSHSVNFEYTGFAKYMYLGNLESTLNIKSKEMDVLDLDVKHDYYRIDNNQETSEMDMKTDIFTASFSIDKSFLEKYGEISGIKYQYYNYKTPWIAYIKNEVDYNGLKAVEGNTYKREEYQALKDFDIDLKSFSYVTKTLKDSEYISTAFQCFAYNNDDFGNDKYKPFGVYYPRTLLDQPELIQNEITVPLIFKDSEADWENKDHFIDRTEVKDIVLKGESKWDGNESSLNISNNVLDYDNEKKGYNLISLESLDETISISKDYEISGWDWFWNGLTFHGDRNEDPVAKELKLFQSLTNEDYVEFNANKDSFLLNNCISEDLANSIFAEADFDNQATYLFRYKNSNFKASNFFVQDFESGFPPNSQGIVYQSSVVLDFNIISFTFTKDGTSTVIPVVHEPFDEYTDLSHESNKGFNWVKFIFICIVTIILFLLLYPILIPVIKFIIDILIKMIKLPFKLIKSLFSKNRKE